MKHDVYETLKIPPTHPLPLFINSSDLGSYEKPFSAITQGELEPQFASKDSYFEKNIKKNLRSNLGVIKHP